MGASAMWTFVKIVAAVAFGLQAEAEGECADAAGCVPFKTVRCESNVMDISFMLDMSGSMKWGMYCKYAINKSCKGHPCLTSMYIPHESDEESCVRQDIMRIVLRLVLKKVFNLFEKDCMNYLESKSYKDSGLFSGCPGKGFTATRFTTIWWNEDIDNNIIKEAQRFSKGASGEWGKSFNEYFYTSDGEVEASKWTLTDEGYVVKDSAIDDFFDTKLLHGNKIEQGGYPKGSGGTYPKYGMEELNRILKSLWDNNYSAEQKLGAKFPVFLMTDGDYSRQEDLGKMKRLSDKLRDDTVDTKVAKVATYGLGLTGNADLKEKQHDLFKNIKYNDETTSNTGEVQDHYFKDQASADKVIEIIFDKISSSCKDCYQLGSEIKCVGMGQDPPTFDGQSNSGGDDVEEKQKTITEDASGKIEVESYGQSYDVYVRVGDKLSMIPTGTTRCKSYLESIPNYKFVEYTSEGKCSCCNSLGLDAGECICDFDTSTALIITKEAVVDTDKEKTVLVDVLVFGEQTETAREIAAGNAKFEVKVVVDSDENITDTGTTGISDNSDPDKVADAPKESGQNDDQSFNVTKTDNDKKVNSRAHGLVTSFATLSTVFVAWALL